MPTSERFCLYSLFLLTQSGHRNQVFHSVLVLVQGFHQEAHRAESIVAGEHGRPGIFHPAVIEALSAVAQSQYKGGEFL